MAGFFTQEATSPDSSIVLIRTNFSCIFVPSKVTQEEISLILNCSITFQIHFDEKSICTTSEAHSRCTPSCKQGSSQLERTPQENKHTVFFTALDPTGGEVDEEYEDSTKPRKVHYKNKWTISQDAIYWINLGQAQDKGLQFWQTRSHAILFL